MKQALNLTVFTAMALSAFWAHAADVYVGVAVGPATSLDAQAVQGKQSATASTTSTTPFKFLLGLDITDTWGIELGYKNLGTGSAAFNLSDVNQFTADAHMSYVAAKVTRSWGDNWSWFTKLGLAQRYVGYAVSGPSGQVMASSANEGALYASAGVAYALSPKLSLNMELETAGQARTQNVQWNTTGLSLGLRYGF